MYTLLQIVQSILSDMDSEDVNSISDTVEATQIASIVRDTFFNSVYPRCVPEHKELLKLTAASDSNYPTHFYYPESVRNIEKLWYEDDNGYYQEVYWCEPLDFLTKTDKTNADYTVVNDKNGGTKIRVQNNKNPTFYTSFDNHWVVMNAHDSTVDSTLQESKVRAYGVNIPTWTTSDSFEIPVNDIWYPYLLAESKSVAISLLKGGIDPKIEQSARRNRAHMTDDLFKTDRGNDWSNYGR